MQWLRIDKYYYKNTKNKILKSILPTVFFYCFRNNFLDKYSISREIDFRSFIFSDKWFFYILVRRKRTEYFICESNKGNSIFFVQDMEEAVLKLDCAE